MPPTTERRPSWDATRMAMARVIAQRSLCSRDRVGAVIVDTRNKVIGEGYNGPPAGFDRNGTTILTCQVWCRRGSLCPDIEARKLADDYSDCPSLHAEANALMMSDRTLRLGGTIYVTSGICFGCAKLIANSGLTTVVVAKTDPGHHHRDTATSYGFLESCGITVIEHEE